MNQLRKETVEEINDMLDNLSSIQCHNICSRVSTPNLVELSIALRKKLVEVARGSKLVIPPPR